MTRAQILAEIISNVLTGGKRTTAALLRQLFSDITNAVIVNDDDKPLLNVTTTSPATGDVIKWDGVKWVNGAGVDISNLVHLSDLTPYATISALTTEANARIAADILKAPLYAPTFSGTVKVINGTHEIDMDGYTVSMNDGDGRTVTQNASGAYATTTIQVAGGSFTVYYPNGAASNYVNFEDKTGFVALNANPVSSAGLAQYNSTGRLIRNTVLPSNTTSTTPSSGSNNTQLATTEFVNTARRGTCLSSSYTATPSINLDLYDTFSMSGISGPVTGITLTSTGNPAPYQKLSFYLHDDTTARAIAWGASFVAFGVALPTTTIANKWLNVEFVYDFYTNKFFCMSVTNQI